MELSRHTASIPAIFGRRIVVGPLAMLVLAVAVLLMPGRANAASCQSSGPAGGAYTVNVCFSVPVDGSALTGDTTVTATADITGTSTGLRRMTFYLGGSYLLTDYQAPYTFTIPTAKFVDGGKTWRQSPGCGTASSAPARRSALSS